MRRGIPWSIAVACLIGMAFVLVVNRRVEVQVVQLKTDSNAAVQRADARVRELQTKLDQQNRELAAALKAEADSKKTAAPAPTGSQPNILRISSDDMRKDPVYAEVWRRQQLRSIQRQYGDAIAAMKLAPDAEAKLRNLLMERVEATADAREAAAANGLTGRDVFTADQAAQQDMTGQIKALIGEDGYAQLQQGSQLSMYKRMVGATVGADLDAAGTPLTAQQEIAMAQVYTTATHTPGMNSGIDPATGLNGRNLSIYNGAAAILNPQQLSTVKSSMMADQLQQQYYEQQRAKAGPSVSGTSMIFMTN